MAPSVFTCCWCITLNYDPNCVYYTSYIFDAILFIYNAAYALGTLSGVRSNAWPHIIFLIISLLILAMGIFAVIQIFTKNTSAGSRQGNYVKYRMWIIIGLVIAAIIVFIFWFIYLANSYYSAGDQIGYALGSALPFLIDAAVLHGYHKNFL